MGDYEKLAVWRKAHALTCAIYRATASMPAVHRYVLGNQLRRAAVSIGANIVEGVGRESDGHLKNHLTFSLGSANEVHYLLLVARDVGALPARLADALRAEAGELRRMTAGFLLSVRHGRRR